MSRFGKETLRSRIESRLRGVEPRLDPADLKLPGLPGDLPPALRPRLRAQPPRPAAVLVPLVDRAEQFSVLLTQRTDHLTDHAGQVSFPGGRIEGTDAGPVAAALRETHEEIGLEAGFVDVVGSLDTYLTITGYAVTPLVGFVREGFELALDSFEVAEAFEVPLDFLMDPDNRRFVAKTVHGVEVGYYEMHYEGRRVWGATAGMIVGLYRTLFEE